MLGPQLLERMEPFRVRSRLIAVSNASCLQRHSLTKRYSTDLILAVLGSKFHYPRTRFTLLIPTPTQSPPTRVSSGE